MNMYKYLSIVAEQIRCKRACPMVIKELKDHIEEQRDDYIAEGMTIQEAEEEAVRQMGDPIEVGVSLDRIHRPKMEWKLLIYVFLLSILGLELQIFMQINAASLLGTDNKMPVIRQCLWMILGIAVMLIICYLDYSSIGQYARGIWFLILAGMLLYRHFGHIVNGGYPKINFFTYAFIPVYAGILYYYRGKELVGLVKSMIFLAVSVLAVLNMSTIVPACILLIIETALLNLAVYKGWFGTRKCRLFFTIWGSAAVIFVIAFLMLLSANRITCGADGISLAEVYQMDRIQSFLHPKESVYYQTSVEMISDAANMFKNGGEATAPEWVMDVRGEFLWVCIFKYLGNHAGIICTALIVGMLIYLCIIVARQKNRLGCMMGLGCTLLIILQVFLYIGMNFGYVASSNVFMPFLSFGGTNLLIIYIYMGLILSICRNSNIVNN